MNDLTAGHAGVMIGLGTKLGFCRVLTVAGPQSSREVAKRSACVEHYLREWLNAQAAGG